METDIRAHLKTLALDYVNNWLTVEKMAEAYNVPEIDMCNLIILGKRFQNEDAQRPGDRV